MSSGAAERLPDPAPPSAAKSSGAAERQFLLNAAGRWH
jgi:hypothetical protein